MNDSAFPMYVVIPAHGKPVLLERTLDSIAAARRPENFADIIVVENGSDAGARQICEQRRAVMPVRYIHLPQPGRSMALNHAVKQIGRGLVFVTDDDVRIDAGTLEAYARAAGEHGETAYFGGPLLIDYEAPPEPWLMSYLPMSAAGWAPENENAPIEKPCFLGANIAFFAQTILELGGFRQDLGVGTAGNLVGEEVDLQERMLKRGCRAVYLHDAKVWHYVPRQRCSPAWALNRIYRHWVTIGYQRPMPPGRQLNGVPRWMWRRAITLAAHVAVTRLSTNAEKRFNATRLYYEWRGYMAGLALQSQQAATNPGVKTHG